jgi:hypothetical protein
LYRFLPAEDFRNPVIARFRWGNIGKYATAFDAKRKRIYYFANTAPNNFHIISPNGKLLSSRKLMEYGKNGVFHYPHLYLEPNGTLHAAWTTTGTKNPSLYWSIHYMLSTDGGETWATMNGTKLEIPVVADDTGPTHRISLDDEFDCSTWLANFLVKRGKVHFIYLAGTQPPRQHYMRYDLASGKRDLHVSPEFKGDQIRLRSASGFFATRSALPDGPLYCVMQDNGHIACLASDDNGETWYDYAIARRAVSPYSISGGREITDDGYIVGCFTERPSPKPVADADGGWRDPTAGSKVHFIKIRAVP